jgi:exonuclease III
LIKMLNNNYNNNSVTDNSLLILLFNANGLRNHAHELETVLNNKRIDIALISETHFTNNSKIYIPGYKLINTNHPDNTAHGGVAIYVKLSITYHPLPGFSQDFSQSCSIQIKLNHTCFTIAAIYSPSPNII